MTEPYKELIRLKCLSPDNRFGTYFFNQHILLVERFALHLCGKLGADRDTVLTAVYFHDIAAITDFSSLAEHPRRGAEMAGDILARDGHDRGWIDSVKRCIETHSVPLALDAGSPEQVCLSNADALSHVANPLYWLYYAFNVRGFDYPAGRKWYGERVNSVWEKLIEPAREMGENHYRFALDLLKER